MAPNEMASKPAPPAPAYLPALRLATAPPRAPRTNTARIAPGNTMEMASMPDSRPLMPIVTGSSGTSASQHHAAPRQHCLAYQALRYMRSWRKRWPCASHAEPCLTGLGPTAEQCPVYKQHERGP